MGSTNMRRVLSFVVNLNATKVKFYRKSESELSLLWVTATGRSWSDKFYLNNFLKSLWSMYIFIFFPSLSPLLPSSTPF